MTDEQMRKIFEEEYAKVGWGASMASMTPELAAGRRIFDIGRKQEAAMWELAAESQRLKLD